LISINNILVGWVYEFYWGEIAVMESFIMRKCTLFAAAVTAIAFTATTLCLSSRANAQPYGPGMMGGYGPSMMQGYGPGMMGSYGMMGGCPMMGMTTGGQASSFAEGRIAFLKAELGITDAQKIEWDAYAETIKRNLQSMQGMWQSMKTVFEAKTPGDRLDAHITAMDSRLAALKEIKPALMKLYDALSPEQKKKADEVLTGMGCMM
jgi:hypothetical protein